MSLGEQNRLWASPTPRQGGKGTLRECQVNTVAPGKGVLQNGTLRQQVIYALFREHFILSIILGWTRPRLKLSNNTHFTVLPSAITPSVSCGIPHARQGTINSQ